MPKISPVRACWEPAGSVELSSCGGAELVAGGMIDPALGATTFEDKTLEMVVWAPEEAREVGEDEKETEVKDTSWLELAVTENI
jgi:hypothetical protein